MHGYVRVGVAVPELRVADCGFNAEKILELAGRAYQAGVKVLTFPELCITGYTCGDLFYQSTLLEGADQALGRIAEETAEMDMLLALGMPVRLDNQLFNCGVLLHRGTILGAVPKVFLPNHSEYYEERWFSAASDLISSQVSLLGQTVPIGSDLLFAAPGEPGLVVGVEICEDLWCPVPPSSHQALGGANLILNLSASNELVSKSDYRRQLVTGQSSRLMAAYAYASAGMWESTTDVVFSGHSLICENGTIMAETALFQQDSQLTCRDVDIGLLMNSRRENNSFMANQQDISNRTFRTVEVPLDTHSPQPLLREITPTPFVPREPAALDQRCQEVFSIQRTALARRLLHTGAKSCVIAVSGGLDSTLALLCAVKSMDFLSRSRQDIVGVTMPGFGTTGRTYQNALRLMASLGVTIREIDIKDACLLHFQNIGQDPNSHDVTYENAQARERTQIVMDLANMLGGMVVGTGDLSELALGFTTYNGDHMSMYNVNCSIPKTLVRALTDWIASSGELDEASGAILRDIIDTPVSPELLPLSDSGEVQQKTEELVGPYELHDFFLYHMVRSGFSPDKILYIALHAFGDKYGRAEIVRCLQLFYRRFFQQQFKRSCSPDGPKVGTVALSPRGDWRMPSDASGALWLDKIR